MTPLLGSRPPLFGSGPPLIGCVTPLLEAGGTPLIGSRPPLFGSGPLIGSVPPLMWSVEPGLVLAPPVDPGAPLALFVQY